MSGNLFVRSAVLVAMMAASLGSSSSARVMAIISGPAFARSTSAPLAGVLTLATDGETKVDVSVDNGTESWVRHFYDFGTAHSVPLLGFKPGRTNAISVTARARDGAAITSPQSLQFITDPLPADFPKIVLLQSNPEKMEPGYTLFRIISGTFGTDYLTIVNSSGEVVWYSGNSSSAATVDVRQLENGDLFFPRKTDFAEINMLGELVRNWTAPAGLAIDFHEGVPTGHGTILYLNDTSRMVTNFPTSATDPGAPLKTARVECDRVVEISTTNGMLLNTWSLIDLLNPTRIDYLTFKLNTANGWDAEHANAIIEDPKDDSIIVSVRNQDAVIKFSRATGRLKWILGPHENWGPDFQQYLLTPVGSPFQWNYAQHAPMITPQGTLLLYDDGNYRASPFDTALPDPTNYSRAVEYRIDEENMEVAQVWEYRGDPDRLFTPTVGDANWLSQRGHVLATFGSITYLNGAHPSAFAPNANMARIKEVTHDQTPEVVFDLAVFDYANTNSSYRGNWVYRSNRIADLYGHPAQPVADLGIKFEDGRLRLEFSGDPTRAYIVEASTDMQHWEEIGEAMAEEEGVFGFDLGPGLPSDFYRILTK